MRSLNRLMPESITSGNNSITAKLILLLSVATAALWITSQLIDVYQYTIVGVFYEIVWLPMLAMLVILPLAGIVFWVKEKFYRYSFYLYSILIIGVTVLLLTFWKELF